MQEILGNLLDSGYLFMAKIAQFCADLLQEGWLVHSLCILLEQWAQLVHEREVEIYVSIRAEARRLRQNPQIPHQ